MHDAVADAMGVARGGAAPQVITWHARRAEAGLARRRFVVRNARDAAAVELTLRPFTRVGSEAVLLGPHASVRVDGRALLAGVEGTQVGATVAEGAAIVEGAEGVLPRGGTALVEIELDLKALIDEAGADRYASRLDVALLRGPAASRSREAATALTLELVVHD
jgi:hypothetical protein